MFVGIHCPSFSLAVSRRPVLLESHVPAILNCASDYCRRRTRENHMTKVEEASHHHLWGELLLCGHCTRFFGTGAYEFKVSTGEPDLHEVGAGSSFW